MQVHLARMRPPCSNRCGAVKYRHVPANAPGMQVWEPAIPGWRRMGEQRLRAPAARAAQLAAAANGCLWPARLLAIAACAVFSRAAGLGITARP